MKVAITGATGFIGRYLIQALKGLNHELLCVGRNKEKLSQLRAQYDVQYLCTDIGNKCENWFEFLGRPDVVIHLAWDDLNDYKTLKHLHQYLPIHVEFIRNLVDNGLRKIVISGTCFEYGLQSGSIQETDSTNPVTPYGTAKDTLRQYLSYLQSQRPFSLIWLRYFYMYGDGQPKKSFFSQLECAIEQNDSVFNMSGGEQLRDYLPVKQIASLTATLACDAQAKGTYNICSGYPVSMRSLAEKKITEKNSSITLKLGHYPYPDYESMAFWGNRTKLDQFLNNRKVNEE